MLISIQSCQKIGKADKTFSICRMFMIKSFQFVECSTANGRGCVSGAWTWSEGPVIAAHYVNCVPMTPGKPMEYFITRV